MSASPEAMAAARRAAMEAEAAGNSALPENAPPARTDAPQSQSAAARELMEQPHLTPADAERARISAKFAASRGKNPDSSTADMQTGVARMLADTEGRPFSADAPAAAQPSAAAPAAALASQPLAESQDMVTLLVDGREVAVPAAEVWRQGMAATQKLSSADVRLERATQAERQIHLERQALDARAAEIERIRAATPTGVAPASTSGTLPTGAQPTREALKKALGALLDSDVDGAAEALDQVVTEQVEARVRAATPAMAASQPTRAAPAGEAPSPWSQSDIEHANTLFVRAYPDIAYNPTVMAQAMQRMQQEMANPVNRDGKVDLVMLADQIGQQFKTRAPAPPPPSQPTPNSNDELAARRQLAARVPGVPPSSVTRSVSPAPTGPVAPTKSEIVQQMRKARGQG